MPLLQRVGEIFIEVEEREAFTNSLERFHVDDIGTTDQQELSVVLLVESPHTHEVGYQYPLAGNTGRYVTGMLGNAVSGPIGRFVHDGHHFLRLGIMNVSRLPFQSKGVDISHCC